MENNFSNLGISPPILKALEEMGFVEPTEVQRRAIPHILQKEDLIVMSKTGSGKTAVFGVSMLEMTDPSAEGPQGLILTPVRELAVQVNNDIRKMAAHLTHKTTAVYGQHNIATEVQALKKGVTIVTGTPGRVYDHIQQGNLVTKNIRFLVLDEADRMLDMGFLDQVKRIIRSIPKNRITLLFSATMPPEIHRICSEYMKSPVTIEIESSTKTVDSIQQEYYRVMHNEKRTQLNRLLLVEQPESCMIFCNTRIAVDQVQNFLEKQGYASEALHGDIPQGKRTKTISEFKNGDFHILVATDVAARGIHIDNLALVINYDVPVEKDSYVHRIGRTGRAGNGGRAVSLVTSDDIITLYEIEEHIGAMIPEAELPSEELLNQRKSEAADWLEANKLKHKPTRPSRKTDEKNVKRSPGTKASKAGDKPRSSTHKKAPDKAKAISAAQAPAVPKVSRPVKAQSSRKPGVADHISSDRKLPNQNIGTSKPVKERTDGQIKQNNGKDRFDRRNYSRGGSSVKTGTKPGISPTVEGMTSPVTASPQTHKKKPFFKRLLEKLLGK